jgi:hypothetical protein
MLSKREMELAMFWVCGFCLGALLGGNWGILLVSCLYALLKPQPVDEPVYYLSARWTPPSAAATLKIDGN